MSNEINIRNKRASFDYEFLEEYTAGIVLTGTEIKSIRAGKSQLGGFLLLFSPGRIVDKGNEYFRIQTRHLLQPRGKKRAETAADAQRIGKIRAQSKGIRTHDYRLQKYF